MLHSSKNGAKKLKKSKNIAKLEICAVNVEKYCRSRNMLQKFAKCCKSRKIFEKSNKFAKVEKMVAIC